MGTFLLITLGAIFLGGLGKKTPAPTSTTTPTTTPATTPTTTPATTPALYFGDKTKPYDDFFDYSDMLSSGRIKYPSAVNFASGIRTRIVSNLFVANKFYLKGSKTETIEVPVPGKYFPETKKITTEQLIQLYGFRFRIEVVNPYSFDIVISKYYINEIMFFNKKLKPIPYFRQLGLQEWKLNIFTASGWNTKYPYPIDINYTIRANSVDYFDIFLDAIIDDSFVVRTEAKGWVCENEDILAFPENGMFAVKSDLEVNGDYANRRANNFGIYYGKTPDIRIEEFWTKQYVGENKNLFIPSEDKMINLWLDLKAKAGVE